MKVVQQLTYLTLSHSNGPAYSTGELLNTPRVTQWLVGKALHNNFGKFVHTVVHLLLNSIVYKKLSYSLVDEPRTPVKYPLRSIYRPYGLPIECVTTRSNTCSKPRVTVQSNSLAQSRKQKAQLLQTGRAMLRVTDQFAKSLEVTQGHWK